MKQTLEVDLDDLDLLDIKLVERGDPALLAACGTLPAKGEFGIISIRYPSGMTPARSYDSVTPFPVGSNCARFFQVLPQGRTIQLFVHVRDPDQISAFRAFRDLAINIRRLGPDGKPRNAWWLARDPNYLPPNAWAAYLKTRTLAFNPPPWLVSDHIGREFVQAYKDFTARHVPVLRKTYPSMASYIHHWMSALL